MIGLVRLLPPLPCPAFVLFVVFAPCGAPTTPQLVRLHAFRTHLPTVVVGVYSFAIFGSSLVSCVIVWVVRRVRCGWLFLLL